MIDGEAEAQQEARERKKKVLEMFQRHGLSLVDGFQGTAWFDANEVAPGLWVGALPAEQSDPEEFHKRSISHVLRCGLSYVPTRHEDELTYLKLDVVDLPSSNILKLCRDQDTNSFIEKGRKAGGVLVHCQAGVSRSATVAAAYLMCSQKIGVQKALEILQAARPIVCPNVGFRAQLKVLETTCNFDITKYQDAPKAEEEFTAEERAARGDEWLAKRQQADAPKPAPAGVWKPKLRTPVLPPEDVLVAHTDEQKEKALGQQCE